MSFKMIPKNMDNCGGLEAMVRIKKNTRVMLRRTIQTDDGLVNGAQGTVVGFEWGPGPRDKATDGHSYD